MSAQSVARPKTSRPKKAAGLTGKRNKSPAPRGRAATGLGLSTWWPLLAGIIITLIAVKTAEILPLMGRAGLLKLQLLYPFALLLKQPVLGLAEQTSDSWSQIMLYAQWILYGLYASVAILWTTRVRALLQLAAVHLVAFAGLWLLSSR